MEVEIENRRSYSKVDKESKSIHEGSKHVYRLKQEMPTRWNSCLAMMRMQPAADAQGSRQLSENDRPVRQLVSERQ